MPVVTIEELDLLAVDDATVAQLAELTTIEEREFAPDDPPVEVAEEADELQIRPSFEERRLWVARDPEGAVLGRVSLEVEHREENRHLAGVMVVVRPEARRQGTGRRRRREARSRVPRRRPRRDGDTAGPAPAPR